MTPAKVCNIVAVGKLRGVDFRNVDNAPTKRTIKGKLSRKVKGNFNGVTIRIPSLCTCILFPNGAVTIVGVKTLSDMDKVMNRLCATLPALSNVSVECEKPLTVCNIVASMSCGRVNLESLYKKLQYQFLILWEPEMFPGMKITLHKGDRNIVAIVFHTGKIIITGAETMNQIDWADSMVNRIIQ